MAKVRKHSKKETAQSRNKKQSKEPTLVERDDPNKDLQGEDLAARKRIGWDKSSDREW